MDWDKVTPELEKKLDPSHVKPPPQGKYGEYIEGWHAIAEANRIFGFDGWSYNVDSLNLTNSGKNGDQHRVGYMAIVSVSVGGIHRTDVGHGQGFSKSEGDAHDSAVKEAVTDALKRALRTFGNPFGLALYDKSKTNVGVTHEPRAVADGLIATIGKAATWIDLKNLTEGQKFTSAFAFLEGEKPPMAAEVKAAANKRSMELDPTGQAPTLLEKAA